MWRHTPSVWRHSVCTAHWRHEIKYDVFTVHGRTKSVASSTSLWRHQVTFDVIKYQMTSWTALSIIPSSSLCKTSLSRLVLNPREIESINVLILMKIIVFLWISQLEQRCFYTNISNHAYPSDRRQSCKLFYFIWRNMICPLQDIRLWTANNWYLIWKWLQLSWDLKENKLSVKSGHQIHLHWLY